MKLVIKGTPDQLQHLEKELRERAKRNGMTIELQKEKQPRPESRTKKPASNKGYTKKSE